MKTWATGLMAALVLSACTTGNGEGDDSSDAVSPRAPAASEGKMILDPESATAGSIIAMTFPEKPLRGIAFSLSPWRDSGSWDEPEFYLMATQKRRLANRRTWWRADDSDGRGWADIGVGGPGPDFVTLPDTAKPGDYLLCTANAKDELCALVTIEA